MHGFSGNGADRATEVHGNSVSQISDIGAAADKSADDAELWFSRIVRRLFSVKPGTALHFISGVDERTCQRYAAGQVRPSGYFIHALLRSKEGEQFLCAIMDGSDVEWWRSLKRAKRIAEAVDRAV